jgi:hypothetical protein
MKSAQSEENMKTKRKFRPGVAARSVCGVAILAVAVTGLAGDMPLSFEASPEVYKVIAENDVMRVVLATWPPGYKDKMHSHPKMFAAYSINDCHRKLIKPDGSVDEKRVKTGSARILKPVSAHVFENVGKTECQNLLVELK